MTRRFNWQKLASIVLFVTILSVAQSFAACTSPSGNAGDIDYSSAVNIMVYCNGTNWISMGSTAPVTYGTLTSPDFCTATSSTAIACTTGSTGTGSVVLATSPSVTTLTVSSGGLTVTTGGLTVSGGGAAITGTVSGTTFSGSGASLTNIGTSNMTAVTGTPSSTTYLRGDNTWATISAGLPSLADDKIWVGQSGTATAVTISQDVTITNAGVATVGKIQNVSIGSPTGTAGSAVVLATSPTITTPTFSGTVTNGTFSGGTWNGSVITGQYGGTGTGTSFTQGSVVFAGASGVYTQNNAQFFWDNTNNRLGIGVTSPDRNLEVYSGSNTAISIYNTVGPVEAWLSQFTDRLQINSTNAVSIGVGNDSNKTLTVNATGLGLGLSPGHMLHLNNDDAYKPNGGSWGNSSDQRLKTNIQPIKDALSRLLQLRGVTFDWKNPDLHGGNASSGGFIAQEIVKVFPDFVAQSDCTGADCKLVDNGKEYGMSLPFTFDAYLVEAIKELKADNDNLRADESAQIAALRAGNDKEAKEIKELRSEIEQLKAAHR